MACLPLHLLLLSEAVSSASSQVTPLDLAAWATGRPAMEQMVVQMAW